VKLIISLIVAIIIFFLYTYFMIFNRMPESIQVQGYLNYITQSPSGFLGAFIGSLAASFFAFTPSIMKIPKSLFNLTNKFTLTAEPIKSIGKVTNKKSHTTHTTLAIQYDGNQKEFNIDNRVFIKPISVSDEVTVFYDPNDPQLAYIDFHLESEELVLNIKESKTLFKLLDITPRFDLSPNSFELTGELYGEKYNKQKSSFIHSFQSNDIVDLVPGKLLPCLITKTEDSFSIQLSINQ
jgi:hypothetical protein